MHDAYARLTPMEVTFPSRDDENEGFPRILREVRTEFVEPTDPGGLLSRVAARELLSSTIGDDESAEAIQEYASLLYHSFNAWVSGSETLLLSIQDVRALVDGFPEGSYEPPPKGGRYVQLPQHLFWVASGEDGAPPESVDGFFVTRGKSQMSVLMAMGMRPDRPGFGVVDVPAQPLGHHGSWLRENMRESGEDFSSSIPGAEYEGLLQFATAGEIMKLATRALALTGQRGMVTGKLPDPAREAGSGLPAPTPSALPFVRMAD